MAVTPGGAGLCATCAWARRVGTRKGAVYLRCGRAAIDPRFEKYPRLPRLECVGYARAADPGPAAATEGAGSDDGDGNGGSHGA